MKICAISSVDRVPGYEPVGRRFESCMARQKRCMLKHTPFLVFYVGTRETASNRKDHKGFGVILLDLTPSFARIGSESCMAVKKGVC